MVTIVQAVAGEEIRQAKELFAEYIDFLHSYLHSGLADLNEVPALTGYEEELAGLPGKFAPPEGRLLLALHEAEIAGCVAFYKVSEGACEVKRLWTRPQFRGKKIGKALVELLIEEARKIGYTSMLLSTTPVLKEALSLYSSLGFEKIASFRDNPEEMMDDEIFMKLDLR